MNDKIVKGAAKPKQHVCLRCGWGKKPGQWVARKKNGPPARCPNCSSPAWNKLPRETKKYHCLRCHETFESFKIKEPPSRCPKCKSPAWQTAKKPKSIKPPGV